MTQAIRGEIAQAIHEAEWGAGSWAEVGQLSRMKAYIRADGALAALSALQREVPDGWQLVPTNPTPEMLEAALDESGQRIEPYIAPRESGVAVECDITEEDAANINQQFKADHGNTYRAMLAAAPSFVADERGGEPS